jgi:hypothetical protein
MLNQLILIIIIRINYNHQLIKLLLNHLKLILKSINLIIIIIS